MDNSSKSGLLDEIPRPGTKSYNSIIPGPRSIIFMTYHRSLSKFTDYEATVIIPAHLLIIGFLELYSESYNPLDSSFVLLMVEPLECD